ncbi:MAG: coenzyme F420-0:L-glutamate ligase [Chloroflexi bacterium]|nr:coenzyme F420-0:L-glutamate ligase [Chloroflexota bacterium]
MDAPSFQLIALPGIPIIKPGDDLSRLILEAVSRAGEHLRDGDIVSVTSKIVSKSEGRFVRLADVVPSERALELAQLTGKDPRIVELNLRESVEISRTGINTMVTRHRLGFVSANAGIDQSNVDGTDETVLLLPVDPDQSARQIRSAIQSAANARVGVIITDSHGRPFRLGNVGVAIGVAGMPALVDLRGGADMFGRILRVSVQGYADMVASAACLLTGEGAEGLPVILVRGLHYPDIDGCASEINRPPETSLYK